ncbi:MAG TPA: ABC transporter permease [Terriglobia bacterium]|nr:ABC transporter permease [Terriglobia bacterium]
MRWYQRFFRRGLTEKHLDAELRFHLEQQIADYVAAGMKPEEARRRARLEFGSLDQMKEECRDVGAAHVVETLIHDIRYALRQLRRNPGFTAVAVLTLALGIGANTAIFSVVDGVLLAPLPYSQPERLVMVWEWNLHLKQVKEPSYPNFLDWQRDARSFQEMAGWKWHFYDLTSPGTPEHVASMEVSSGFFRMLGAKLALGREFSPEEDRRGGAPVAIINDRLWKDRFASNPKALGESVTLNKVEYTIVGVLPPGFNFYGDTNAAKVYTPLGQGDPLILSPRGGYGCLALARLKPGVSIAEAQADMSTIQNGLDQLYPEANKGMGTEVVSLKKQFVGDVGGTLLLLLGAVGLVLLIACGNVANLLLARSAARAREFAIRSALGAKRARVVRQLLTESILLSLAGGGLGLLVAVWAVKPVLAAMPGSLPRSGEIGLNVPVLLFALGVAIAVGVLFGLAPALKSSKSSLQDVLKEGGRTSTIGHHHLQNSLVIFQMALTLVLLASAGLLFRTIRNLWESNPGFEAQHLITFQVEFLPYLTKTPFIMRTAYEEMLDRIRNIPGVESADFTYNLPLNGWENNAYFWIGSEKPAVIQSAPQMQEYNTGPDYLRTMRIPLLRGRFFTPEDNNSAPCVAVIDSVMAHTYFPDQNPLGQMLTFGWTPPLGPCRIIGVVGHVKHSGLGDESGYVRAESYYPLYQLPDQWVTASEGYRSTTIIVRTPLAVAAVMPAIKKAVYGTGREQPVYNVKTMQEIASDSMASQRFPMILLGAFAGLALLLASIGIYGVISYSVTQRAHEIGIRMALGAERRHVLRMTIGQGLRLAVAGLALGVAAALLLARTLSSFSGLLYGVRPGDPLTFVLVSLVLTAVALLASYIPARRATEVDPMVALRYE